MAADARFVGSVEITATAATAATSSGTTSATGSTFVVFASTTDTAFAATPITDNKGNTYTLIGTVTTDATFTTTTGYWRCENGVGGSGHIATVHNNATGLISAFLIEVTGAASSSVLDVHNENNVDSATPFTSASVTTTRAVDVILAFELDNRSSATAPTWGNGYTSLGDLSNNSGITASVAKLAVSSTGAQQSSFTDAAVTRAITWIAAFSAPVVPRTVGMSPHQGPGIQAAGRINQFTSSPRSSFIFPPPAPPPPVVAMPIRNPGPFNNAQFIPKVRFAGLSAAQPVVVIPPAGSLTLTGLAPTVIATANQVVKPPAGTLTLTGRIPTILTPVKVIVPVGSLTLTGFAPNVSNGANVTIGVPAASLTLSGKVPVVAVSNNQRVAVPAGSLSLTGLAPTVTVTQNVLIRAPAGHLALTGFAPIILGIVVSSADAGRPRRRIRDIYRVTVDGEVFEFASLAEAIDLLNRAQGLAAQVAAQKARQATERAIPQRSQPTLALPRIAVNSRDLRAAVTETKRAIAETYRRALVDAEIAVLIELKTRDEQNEDAMWLLM